MIGFLRGRLHEKCPPVLVLDVNGVGYELQAPMTTFYQLPEAGSDVTLFTHLVVREDAHQLYGFADTESRELFRELIKVNGVGPKMALAILSALDAAEIIACVTTGNTGVLVRVPGIGKKTAERLLVELRDRVARWGQSAGVAAATVAGQLPATGTIEQDAASALQALGYKPQEAERAVQAVLQERAVTGVEELIRWALRNMVSRQG